MSDLAGSPSRTRLDLTGWLAAFATVTIWAVWAVATRHAVTHDLPPAAIGLLRFGVPALLLLPISARTGLFPKGLGIVKGLGLLGSGAPFFLIVALGMQYAPAAEIGPLLPGTMPLFVALVGWLVFGERLARLRVAGFGLVLLGIVCITGQWGIYTHAYRRSGLSALQAASLIGLWSFLLLLPFGAPALVQALGDGQAGPVIVQAVVQGFASGVAGIVLYGIAVDRLGASRAAAVSPLSIVLAALLAVPILGEIPDMAALIGIIVATLGVVLASGVFGSARTG
ncbi:DMT family transporter [Microvirga sp. HBU67558]|uniref:DMT family transporter n=1 Tax=Microvirga TaxID=186650 RepID=UPI001B386B06|nr:MULTISPECIES: DMT family transporter [unclassified Microvirga]MBQ0823588.1 DMT family transporter [Microvirga sp. HBU67558]